MFVVALFNTPAGVIEVAHDTKVITRTTFVPSMAPTRPRSLLCEQIEAELFQYYQNPNHRFNLPLNPVGTPYQVHIWSSLQDIPSGTCLTYRAFAEKLKTGARAIGQACRANPIPLFIPCHRIVRQEGLGGYLGHPDFVELKAKLLQHEQPLNTQEHHGHGKVLFAPDFN